ncbi:MAG: hypothetical protein WAZ77_22930, partial [Candidatus Nitrosopolaris sp.]
GECPTIGYYRQSRPLDACNIVAGLRNMFALWLLKPKNQENSGIVGFGVGLGVGVGLFASQYCHL